uniref:DnaJ protein P58IPK homolog n=1 Tax=Tanacetum cinerariifolium TaxID=118510 RepID=A0A699K544_TANCI|nr:DnaJ protein P58IPK homolog [Tanacetum cinerariifolium]
MESTMFDFLKSEVKLRRVADEDLTRIKGQALQVLLNDRQLVEIEVLNYYKMGADFDYKDYKAALGPDPDHVAHNVHLHFGLLNLLVKLRTGSDAIYLSFIKERMLLMLTNKLLTLVKNIMKLWFRSGPLDEEGSRSSYLTEPELETSPLIQILSVDLHNTVDPLRSSSHFEDGHGLSSLEICSRMH